MSRDRAALRTEYTDLLRAQGIDHLVTQPITAAEETRLIARIREQARQSAADYGVTVPLPSDEDFRDGPPDRYAAIAERIERAAVELGAELPGAVLVGEYPHQSLNAQAMAARHGTLLLVNTGLHYLLVEVALALTTRVVTSPDERPTEAMVLRRAHADENLAGALAVYLLRADPRGGGKQQVDGTGRGAMAFLMAAAAEDFAVAHEYGHFLAGHLRTAARDRTGSGWLRKSRDQEYEADEIGILLMLRARADEDLFRTGVMVCGVFLFLAVDHLLTRIRDEIPPVRTAIVADHPPADARAATLRRTLTEMAGPDVFQLSDAAIPILAGHEDRIIAALRRQLG